ncbi:MAG TPA: lytic transglycosylase domain-containing protein, partial [Asticcacaulis sp.]|nr:lytic transglycosylase domain-containing protein [Asticcacaulis sp.]
YDRFGYPGLFIAYNAGPNAYIRSLKGAPLSSETRAYVTRIERDLDAHIADKPRLFIKSDASSKPAPTDGLFVRLREPTDEGR